MMRPIAIVASVWALLLLAACGHRADECTLNATCPPSGAAGHGGEEPCATSEACDDENPCTVDACSSGTCIHENDDVTVPNDANECTDDACENGHEVHEARTGMPCGQIGTLKCNDKGQCADCTPGMELIECPAATQCQEYICTTTDKVCLPQNLSPGTMLDDSMPGDCKRPQCDGMGAVIEVASTDLANLPVDDGNDCTDEICDGLQSTHPYLDSGESCNSMGGKVCDGAGHCVGCLVDSDCTGTPPSCDLASHTCMSCSDGVQNGSEMGIDCGGSCAAKCNGDTCTSDGECFSAHCADGFCCDTACGASDICKACNVPGHAGVCTALSKGLEDLATCAGGLKVCNGVGICANVGNNMAKAGGPCAQDGDCYNGVCSAGICRLPIGAPCDEHVECESILCANNVCEVCVTGPDCATGTCANGVCTIQGGAPCGANADCAGGKCDGFMLCGRSLNSACAVDADCSSHHCILGICTACLNGMDLTCASMECGAGNCLLPHNAYCSADGQCSSQTCAGFPKKCQ